ncbi:MAG: SAM-dependent chlorinase/fluorinase [Peptococcaceae bacterium]
MKLSYFKANWIAGWLKVPVIVLLTDFGRDPYVGVMKGIILSICPRAQLIDLVHHVTPQNIREGAWLLLANYAYFPKGSIFLAVVDPGVGTRRKALAIKTKAGYFIGPDNGLLYPALVKAGMVNVIELDPPKGAGFTFHGRDVFAPAAAKLAAGVSFHKLGKPGEPENKLNFYLAGRNGEVVTIDRFGNVITNVPPLLNCQSYVVKLMRGERSYFTLGLPYYPAYAMAPANDLFLITGSNGTLEISVKNGSAASTLPAQVGDRATIE